MEKKHKDSGPKSNNSYQIGKSGWKLGLGSILIIATVATALLLSKSDAVEEAEANPFLPSQGFVVSAASDTVIETDGGLVIAIPQGAFLDKDGNPVKGNIDFEVKEALDPADILEAGLSTESNGEALETGGMFYLNASQNGKALKIAPKANLYVDVPTDQVLPDMQLFEGKRMKDKSINWVNPKPIERFLTPVDIYQLNFYPPGFEESLSEWGYDASNKAFKDSVFYSFSCADLYYADEFPAYPKVDQEIGKIADEARDWEKYTVDTSAAEVLMEDSVATECWGIEPANIKAIWNDRFQNTNLATKAFEERMPILYETCNLELLELYVKHLNRPLYEIDSMISEMGGAPLESPFWDLYLRKDGRVKVKDRLTKKLGNYYTTKSRIYAKAIAETNEKFRKEEQKLNQHRIKKEIENNQANAERKTKNYTQELELNLNEAYRQLGLKRPRLPIPPNTYPVSIKSTGWHNVDRYVVEATTNRTTLDYTAENGKKAVINYEEISVELNKVEAYDRALVYLVSDEQYSFLRMKQDGKQFKQKLNELMNYHLIAIAYKGEQAYFYSAKKITPGSLSVGLKAINKAAMKRQINALCMRQSQTDLLSDLKFESFRAKDDVRQKRNEERYVFRNRLKPIIFPCMEFALDDILESADTPEGD